MAMSLFSLALLSEWVALQPLLFCMPESKGKDGRIKSLLTVKYICSQREAHFQLCSLLIYKYKTKYSKPSQTQERQRKDGIFLFSLYLLYIVSQKVIGWKELISHFRSYFCWKIWNGLILFLCIYCFFVSFIGWGFRLSSNFKNIFREKKYFFSSNIIKIMRILVK